MSPTFLLLTTWWAHNPQFHRIETWLSCTTWCQSYSSCLTLYVIHGPLACWSILVSDTILIPVALNPFRTLLQAMNDCLSAWNLLLHRLTLLSMCVICSTRELLICLFLGYPRWISLITSYHCRAAPYLFVSTMEFPEERTTTSSWCFGIKNWRHQRKGLTSSRRSIRITRTSPLLPS